MKQFYLVEITTKDKFIHQGILFKPTHTGKKAILWVHGLTDNFYGDMGIVNALVQVADKEGWGVASFNNRGHDIITNLKKLDPKNPKGHTGIIGGSAYESFPDCVYDIDAGIAFLEKQGFGQIIIAGISTGANKACYYAGTQKDPRVTGVLLASPLSDVPIESKGKNYMVNLKKAKQIVVRGQGDKLVEGFTYLPLTAKRHLSLYQPGNTEDVFDYYAKNPKLKTFSNITKPLCIIFGGADEYNDRPAKDILTVFKKYQKSVKYHQAIIPGAFHSFGGKEKEFVGKVAAWIKFL